MTSEISPENQAQIDDIESVRHFFTYHPPRPDQIPYYNAIREQAKGLAESIAIMVPRGVERDRSIEALREAVMFANAGIACSKVTQ